MIDPLGSDQSKPTDESHSSFDDKASEVSSSRHGKSANDALKPPVHEGATQANSASSVESESQKDKPSGFRRAFGAARAVLPAILPLLEGNVAAAATNLLTSSGKHANLSKIENTLARMRAEQGSYRGDLSDYKHALRQFEDQLKLLKETADQSGLNQQKLEGDLRSLRKRLAIFVWIAAILLVSAISIDVYLVLHLHYGHF